MHLAAHDIQQLVDEYHVLLRHYGHAQARCDALVRAQAAEIARLQGQVMRLRAAVIVRDTANAPPFVPHAGAVVRRGADELSGLEASFAAADLVICQTGCLSHGAYWRVQDHCRRTGKTCVLVAQSDAARIDCFAPSPLSGGVGEEVPAQEGSVP